MTPLSRDLHPSNGRRRSLDADDVLAPTSLVARRAAQLQRAGQDPQDALAEPTDDDATGPVATVDPGADDADAPEDTDFPGQLHHQILEMMASGCDDEIIARHLHLDVAALRGAILELSAAAGSCNRFQLALRARDLGWI
ncbi:hypothetical protein FCK90_07785 [Kocuria coralli]|uniref:Uncharacterized protein n=1 Tax=Kocuria coralli TaxID=1461025 RepID=A0A5J5KYH8_9MICC|nr:hypothetical protein [Kocuria coralli]KAA9394360.1 hypothetical protein FCK90_07785 [Kocuria coralli]